MAFNPNYETGVEPHIALQSLVLKAKANREEQQRLYQQREDLPAIMGDIKAHEESAKAAQARINELDISMQEAPPEMATRPDLTLGETLATAAGALFGTNAGTMANAGVTVANDRATKAFQNAMRSFQNRRETAGMKREQAVSDLGFERSAGLSARGAQYNVMGQNVAGQVDAIRQEGETEQRAGLMGLQQQWDEHMSQVRFGQEKQLNEAQNAFHLQLQEASKLDDRQKLQAGAMLQGLAANEDETAVDAALKGLTDLGLVIPSGATEMYKAIAKTNKADSDFKKKMMELDVQFKKNADKRADRGQALDEKKWADTLKMGGGGMLPGNFPGSGYAPMGVGGIDPEDPYQRPSGGKQGETEVQQMLDLQAKSIVVNKEFDELKDAATATITRNKDGQRIGAVTTSGQSISLSDYDDAKKQFDAVRGRKREIDQLLGVARKNVETNAGPQFKAWRDALRKYSLAEIGKISQAGLDPKRAKLLADEFRSKFKEATGMEL
jgi:hypothetical protein